MTEHHSQIVLITGASRGIGAAVAKAYGAKGAHVILVARTVGGLEETDDAVKKAGGSSTLVPMDLTQFEKIDQLGGVIHERFGRLDGLIANAAMLGELSPLAHTEPKVWDKVIATNLTANYRLIRSMDALLRRSKSALVQFVTSGITQSDRPFWGAYAVSKAGLETLAGTYREEVKSANIRVEIVDPGIARTRMRASAYPGEDPMRLPTPEEAAERFVTAA